MEIDKFGRRRKNDVGGRSIPSYQLLQLQRYLKNEISSFSSEKNLDKLILIEEGSSIRIRNVRADKDSLPTDAVNISYLEREVEKKIKNLLAEKNLDKLVLTSDDRKNLIRIRNVRVDDNSESMDAVNVAYVSKLAEKIELLEKEIESMKNLLIGAKSITYSTDSAMTTRFSE